MHPAPVSKQTVQQVLYFSIQQDQTYSFNVNSFIHKKPHSYKPHVLLIRSLFVQMGTTLCIPCYERLLLVHSLCHIFLLVLIFLSSVFVVDLLLIFLSCQMLVSQRFKAVTNLPMPLVILISSSTLFWYKNICAWSLAVSKRFRKIRTKKSFCH